jgi:DNA excision repair protein ERCC-4
VSLLKYLDMVLAAHSAPPGSTKHTFSPWLFLDAAHILFETAKSRVHRGKLDGLESSSSTGLPDKLEPVLEEQPKWAVLAEVLDEIEQDLYFNPVPGTNSNAAILIMCGDQQTSRQVREYIETMHVRVKKEQTNGQEDEEFAEYSDQKPSAEFMMRQRLREYLRWKPNFRKANENLYGIKPKQKVATEVPGYSSITSSTTPGRQGGRAPPNKRRRVRGASSAASTPSRAPNSSLQPEVEESPQAADLLLDIQRNQDGNEAPVDVVIVDDLDEKDEFYDLYDMNDLIITHAYEGDMDDHILEEARPRYIIMYEPDAAFIRRVEVYRSSHTDRSVRVYFMYYGESVEERRYLSAVRREKDAFTKLIKEKGVRLLSSSLLQFTSVSH